MILRKNIKADFYTRNHHSFKPVVGGFRRAAQPKSADGLHVCIPGFGKGRIRATFSALDLRIFAFLTRLNTEGENISIRRRMEMAPATKEAATGAHRIGETLSGLDFWTGSRIVLRLSIYSPKESAKRQMIHGNLNFALIKTGDVFEINEIYWPWSETSDCRCGLRMLPETHLQESTKLIFDFNGDSSLSKKILDRADRYGSTPIDRPQYHGELPRGTRAERTHLLLKNGATRHLSSFSQRRLIYYGECLKNSMSLAEILANLSGYLDKMRFRDISDGSSSLYPFTGQES